MELAGEPRAAPPAELIADVQVWRAATQVDPSDLRLTGPPQLGHAARILQQQLDKRLAAAATDEDLAMAAIARRRSSQAATADSFLPELTERLSNLSRAGFDTSLLVRSAAAEGPLPDDHPAAALWWRILDQLAPQMPNRYPATPNPVPTTRRTATTSPRRQRPVPRSTPPPAPVRPGAPSRRGGRRQDSCAFGRAAARDLVDVAALLGRYTLEQLCELAAEKDAGFDRRVFADALAAAAAHSDAAFAELGLGRQLWPPYGRARLDGAPNCWMPRTCPPRTLCSPSADGRRRCRRLWARPALRDHLNVIGRRLPTPSRDGPSLSR